MEIEHKWFDDFEVAMAAAGQEGKGVLLQFYREECAGCRKMYSQVYPNADVQNELFSWFIPLRQDIIQNRPVRARYSAYWTPSFYFINSRGNSLYSFNGYQNAGDFRVLMRLGKASLDMPHGKYFDVINLMDDGLAKFPANPRAAALLFMRGMAEYLVAKEKSSFRGAMTEIIQQYPDSLEARMWPWMDQH